MRLLRHGVCRESWGGVISLSPVVEGLKRVERGVDKTASELALVRLQKEIDALDRRHTELWGSRQSWQAGFKLGGGFCVYVGIFSLFALGASSEYLGAGLFGLFWVLVGAGLILIGVKVFGESDEEEQLLGAIVERRAEIARHQQIVKS